jgi:hypothetical protein
MARQKHTQVTTLTSATQPSPGPLAVWRLPLSVGVAAACTGMPLLDALTTGQHLDLALGRSFGAAFFVWIATGRVNHILADAETRRVDRSDAPTDADEHIRS